MERDATLIEEAIAVNFKDVGPKSQSEYKADLFHYADYLHSAFKLDMLTVEREHVRAFLNHLKDPGGQNPAESRQVCAWCKANGYPMGRKGKPLSASRRKKYLSAVRFVYHHAREASGWPSVDPSAGLNSPQVTITRGFVPERDELRTLLDAKGDMRGRLLLNFLYYVPARREEVRNVRWSDIMGLDTSQPCVEIRRVKGGGRADFSIAPKLRAVIREYREWQLKEAQRNPRVAAALADEETAYLLLSKTGRLLHASSLNKIVNRRAVAAGVGLKRCNCTESIDGYCSKVTPHVFRHAWATVALNDPKHPVPIDVVSKALGHKDIGTTRRHYAHTDDDRVMGALLSDRL